MYLRLDIGTRWTTWYFCLWEVTGYLRLDISTIWCYHSVPKRHPPQKYQHEDDPVLMVELVPDHFLAGTFRVDL